jgi:hypothetical protein
MKRDAVRSRRGRRLSPSSEAADVKPAINVPMPQRVYETEGRHRLLYVRYPVCAITLCVRPSTSDDDVTRNARGRESTGGGESPRGEDRRRVAVGLLTGHLRPAERHGIKCGRWRSSMSSSLRAFVSCPRSLLRRFVLPRFVSPLSVLLLGDCSYTAALRSAFSVGRISFGALAYVPESIIDSC